MTISGHPGLIHAIKKRLERAATGTISFAEFMEFCLYHPTWGYYQVSAPKLGKDGDFYTSAGIGSIMGEITARFFLQYAKSTFAHASSFHYIEWGGGNGKWAKDMLDTIFTLSPSHYERMRWTAIESSPAHREQMAQMLSEHREKVTMLNEEEWNDYSHDMIHARFGEVQFVLGNEFLDAFPVHRIGRRGGVMEEIGVGWNEERGTFSDIWIPLTAEVEAEVKNRSIELVQHQSAEINLGLTPWFVHMSERMREGVLLLIDYGDVREEVYADHRMNGTLMCYQNHRAHDDPYQFIGQQDLTSHVDFTACIEAARLAGFDQIMLVTQKQWLLDQDLLSMLEEHVERDPFAPVARRNRAIRQLLLSDGMSELFKVLSMIKKP